jgi:hypothetical protein
MGQVSTILSLFTGSNSIIAALIAAAALAIGSYVKGRLAGAKAERNANRAKDADAYEQHLREIANASIARPSGSVSDDPRNRDRH